MNAVITDRQLEIIESAGRILSSSGVSGLTTKRLAQEMDFSESALYRHFSSKEKIIIALLQHIATELDKRYTMVCEEVESPDARFKRIFQAQFDFFYQNPHFAVAVFSEGLMAENETINKAVTNIMDVKQKHLTPVLLAGQKQGFFTKELKAEMILHIVMGSVRLLLFKWRVADFGFDLRKKGKELMEANMRLIKE